MKYKVIAIAILLFFFVYATYITSIPSNIIIFQGEKINIKKLAGVVITPIDAVTVFSSESIAVDENKTGKIDLQLNLFDIFKVKDVTVNVIPRTTVIPVREYCWIKTVYRWCPSGWNVRNRWSI